MQGGEFGVLAIRVLRCMCHARPKTEAAFRGLQHHGPVYVPGGPGLRGSVCKERLSQDAGLMVRLAVGKRAYLGGRRLVLLWGACRLCVRVLGGCVGHSPLRVALWHRTAVPAWCGCS